MPLRRREQPEITDSNLRVLIATQVAARREMAHGKKIDDDIKKRVKPYLDEHGVETDKGHRVVEVGIDGCQRVEHRLSITETFLDDKARELIKAKGLEKQCLKTITVVDQDALMAVHYQDKRKLSEKEIDSLIRREETWSYWIVP